MRMRVCVHSISMTVCSIKHNTFSGVTVMFNVHAISYTQKKKHEIDKVFSDDNLIIVLDIYKPVKSECDDI